MTFSDEHITHLNVLQNTGMTSSNQSFITDKPIVPFYNS